MQLKTFNSESAFIEASVKYLEDVCASDDKPIRLASPVAQRRRPSTVPLPKKFQKCPKPISNSTVDERYVPPDHQTQTKNSFGKI